MAGYDDIKADIANIGKIQIVPSLLDVVCKTTGMGFAAIARLTDERWIACSVKDDISFGLVPGGELMLETTICNEIRQDHQPVVINHVDQDEKFSCHPTPLKYGFQSYISMPIFRKDGSFFGTLCAIDPKPAKINTPEIIGMFRLVSDLISFHLDAVEKMDSTETSLREERTNSVLREQFIAVLGHDLRTPLSAVSSSAQLLKRSLLTPETSRLVDIIKDSTHRMRGLIENVLDFARGRLGGGINLKLAREDHVEELLNQVINELIVTMPDRSVETIFNITSPITCDGRRVSQLFSNILGNALSYGLIDKPVRVIASTQDGVFKVSVSNAAPKIPTEVLNRLFKPFSRGEVAKNQQGLGLGLYIAHEIAAAHHGTISVSSTDEETSFVFEMPIQLPGFENRINVDKVLVMHKGVQANIKS